MQRKNKGKGKPARNPPPVQKTTATPSVAIPQPPPPVVEGRPIEIGDDNRVPEIQATPIIDVPEKEIQKNQQEPGPVKPKRHRGGKKRKQNENKSDTNELEITEISSEPLDGPIIIANVDIIETKPTNSQGFTEKAPIIEKIGETVEVQASDVLKDPNQNKQPIAPKKKKGKHQKSEQQGSDSFKPISDIYQRKDEHDESVLVKGESQTIVDEIKKSEVEKSEAHKKDSNVQINIQAQKCEPKSDSKNLSEREECQKNIESQSKETGNKNRPQKSSSKKSEPKDAIKKTDTLLHACDYRKSESPKIELQKSEHMMDVPNISESEQQKCETHKNKKQKTETQKENVLNNESETKSTELLKSEIHQSEQTKEDQSGISELTDPTTEKLPDNCNPSIQAGEPILTEIIAKPELILKDSDLPKQHSTGSTCVTEGGSNSDEKHGKNKKNKDSKSPVVKTGNPENIISGTKETLKFAPDISVVTELPVIDLSNLHKESLPKISEEQNKVTITEIIEKEVEIKPDHLIIIPDKDYIEKQSVEITDPTIPSEQQTKGGKGKKGIKKQKDYPADISDIAKESTIEKDSMEMLLPSLPQEKDIDFSDRDIIKTPEKPQSDIARDLKCIEDEMKIIMDLTPALSNISIQTPQENKTPNKEIKIDLICEIPANTVSETSFQHINKEATSIPSHATTDSSLEMEMWKEVIEKSLREFTELESKNESIGMISQEPFLQPAIDTDILSANTQLPELSTLKIETEMSDLTFKRANTGEDSVKENVSPIVEKNTDITETHSPETKLVPKMKDIVVPTLEVKLEALIGDQTIESQNTSQQEKFAGSHEQKHKGKGKSKKGDKKNKQEASATTPSQTSTSETSTEKKDSEKSKSDIEDKNIEQSKPVEEKGKSSGETKDCQGSEQTCFTTETKDSAKNTEKINIQESGDISNKDIFSEINLLPTSSSESNAQDVQHEDPMLKSFIIPTSNNDLISLDTTPVEPKEIFKPDKENKDGENPICTRPKNLLGHPNIPVTSNKNDYKKEKNKNVEKVNPQEAKIKMKDISKTDLPERSNKTDPQSIDTNKKGGMAESDDMNNNLSVMDSDNEEEEYVYKYSFRKVFLANTCNICKVDLLNDRMTCGYCNLVGYCGQRHKDDDWTQHQALCFAVSTIVHLKGLKFVYADAKSMTGHEYRLLRMQTIVSCEKILKRKLTPWEQEMLLYPRMCFDSECREFRPALLQDCKDCSQVSFCKEYPLHLSLDHKQWCKSYKLYQKMVLYQHEKGRLEPKLPSKIITNLEYQLPADMTSLLKQLYGNDFGLDDCYYAALTQIATAPLTALYGYQLYIKTLTELSKEGKMIMNGIHQHDKFTIHIVGAELQFEADTLGKWEILFLHLYPGVTNLTVTFIGPELNPSNLPLELLNRIRMCNLCKQAKRKVDFEFYDRILYHNFVKTTKFTKPDLICAFNPGLHRTTGFSGLDSWPDTIRSIMALHNTPFCVTSYTKHELPRDLLRVKECVKGEDVKIYLEPSINPYSSTRPDRNFISDDEMPLIFKNYYLMVVSG